jgi:RNA polymerase sigma-70 factor (TIGR02943 family)
MSQETLEPQKWVERYSDMMYRYTLVRVKDPETAEELVQQTFFAALKSQNSYAGKSTEKTWLFGILKHKTMDFFRGNKRHISFDPSSEESSNPIHFNASGHMVPRPENWNLDPEKAAENSELARVLAQCMNGLPEKFHRVFVFKEVDGMSSEEICNELDIKPTNLWVILHRARNQLKLCLESNWLNNR